MAHSQVIISLLSTKISTKPCMKILLDGGNIGKQCPIKVIPEKSNNDTLIETKPTNMLTQFSPIENLANN